MTIPQRTLGTNGPTVGAIGLGRDFQRSGRQPDNRGAFPALGCDHHAQRLAVHIQSGDLRGRTGTALPPTMEALERNHVFHRTISHGAPPCGD